MPAMTSAATTRSHFHATQTTGSTGKAHSAHSTVYIRGVGVCVCFPVCVYICAPLQPRLFGRNGAE